METLSIIFLTIGIYILIKWFIVVILFQDKILNWAKKTLANKKKIKKYIILVLISAIVLILIGIILRSL